MATCWKSCVFVCVRLGQAGQLGCAALAVQLSLGCISEDKIEGLDEFIPF